MDWTHSTALITGASSGIGADTARYLSRQGISVILIARREDRLLEVQKEILEQGGQAKVYQADLASEQERVRIFREITQNHGTPDILINNAGFGWYGYFSEMPVEICMQMIEVDVIATIHLTRLFLPDLLRKESARIINIGSIAGGLPEQGVVIYSASKAFLDSFSIALNRELAGTSTRVSVIRCGPVKTEFFDRARSQPNGYSVPAEHLAVSVEKVSKSIWRMILHPRRVLYVPFYYFFSPLVEILFSSVIDRLGPLLLRRNIRKGKK